MKKIAVVFSFVLIIIFVCGCGLTANTPKQQKTPQVVSSVPQNYSQVPSDSSSQLGMTSFGATGMYNFFCYEGCIYEFIGDSQGMVLTYKPSEVSSKPIGNTYNPLEEYTFPVYGVSGVQNANATDAPQSIAIFEYEQFYCRADFFLNGNVNYKGKTYLISPVSIAGDLTSDKFQPFEADKKIGTTAEGYDVYSLKNPGQPGEFAVDISGMTCDIGLGKLYPLAIPNQNG